MAGTENSITVENLRPAAAADVNRPLRLALMTARILAGLSLVLIALGGYVRATGAGLSCPDWPLCFGRVVPPEFGSGVAQEVTHRFVASALAIGLLAFFFFTSRIRKSQPRLFHWALFLAVLLAVQVVFGGLTVLMQLNPFIVTAHLALGTLLFQTLALLGLERSSRPAETVEKRRFANFSSGVRRGCWLVTGLIILQILVGGFVGSSGAALACPDAPMCFGRIIPPDASGPVLLQVGHRLLGFALIAALFFLGLNLGSRRSLQMHTFGILFLVGIQITIGIANVSFQIPALITIAHLIVAQLILFGAVVLVRRSSNIGSIVLLEGTGRSDRPGTPDNTAG